MRIVAKVAAVTETVVREVTPARVTVEMSEAAVVLGVGGWPGTELPAQTQLEPALDAGRLRCASSIAEFSVSRVRVGLGSHARARTR